MRSWRRLHAPDLIAQVEPIGGFGTWKVSAWRTDAPERALTDPRAFQLLTEAQQAADTLTRSSFAHACTGRCGQWLARAG